MSSSKSIVVILWACLSVPFVSFSQSQVDADVDTLVSKMKASFNNLEELRSMAYQTLEIGKVNDHSRGLAMGYKFLGIYHYQTSSFDSSLHYQNLVLNTLDSTEIAERSTAYLNISTTYSGMGDYDKCVEYALKGIEGFRELNDVAAVGKSFNLLGVVYYQQGDSKRALEYFRDYYRASIEGEYKIGIAESMNNMGAMHQSLQTYDSSIYYFTNAVQYKKELKQFYGLGNTYQNIGGMYMDLDQFDKAQVNYDSALIYYQKYGERRQVGATYQNMGRMNWQAKRYRLALDQARNAQRISNEVGDRFTERNAQRLISRILEAQGRHEQSLDAFEEFYKLDTALFNSEKADAVEEMRIQFETEKKDREIAELNLDNANNQISIQQRDQKISQNRFIIVGLVLFLLAGFALVLWWRGRNKLIQSEALNQQAERLQGERLRAVIESQENERKRFARDLHDSFGPQLTTLKMELDQEDIPRDKLVADVGSLAEQIREIAFGLMPQVLASKGLVKAFEEFTHRVNRMDTIQIDVDASDLKPMDEWVEVSIYRISQEWINNVLKYSNSTKINIQFTQENHRMLVSIEDDGDGFDTQDLTKGQGNGWNNIQSRAEMIRGSVTVESSPGRKGSVLFLDLPTA